MKKLYNKDNIEAFILTYNRKDMLKESIISILNQTIGEVSITIMDNGSTDGTNEMVAEMMQTHSNVHYYRHEQNVTQRENFQKAVELAKADYVIMFHDDDILHPDYLKFAMRALNKYSNISLISSCYKEYSNPTNDNWGKASSAYDYCKDKKTFINYLYRMQRYGYSDTIYKTQNLKDLSFDIEYYAKFGKMADKPFVASSMKDDEGAAIFRDRKLLRYRVHPGQDTLSSGPYYSEIIEYSKYCKEYMQNSLYEKFMFNLINYKQLKCAYVWGKDYTLSLDEFIKKAISEGAGCKWTELSLNKYYGKFFIELAHILRKIFKTKYKRVF